jgi:hypothetical protein
MDERIKRLRSLGTGQYKPRTTPDTRDIINFLEGVVNNSFASSLVHHYKTKGWLSEKQLEAARKMRFEHRLNEVKTANAENLDGVDVDNLKSGMYYEPESKTIWNIYDNSECRKRVQHSLNWGKVPYGLLKLKILVAEGNAYKMTKEEQVALGQKTGICVLCGRLLEDEKSIAEGVGPICKKKLENGHEDF